MKIPIEFPVDYVDSKPGVLSLGRLQLGNYIGRLYFSHDGKMRLAIDRGAVDEGFVVLSEPYDETKPIFGFPENKG